MEEALEVQAIVVDCEPMELIKAISQEGVDPQTGLQIKERFLPFFEQAEAWKVKAEAINVTDVSQVADMKMARVARLALKEIRVNADKTRKDLKEDSLRYGKAVQGVYNIIEYLIVPIEKRLEEQEKFAEVQEAKRQAELKANREMEVQAYDEFIPYGINLGTMSDEDYSKLLNGAKLQLQAKLDAEAKAKAEQEAKIKAEAEERQRIIEENNRLKAEREAQEKALAEQRAKAEAERLEAERKAAEERAKAEAIIKAEREELEKVKQEARDKAEAERKAQEAAKQAEAERLAAIELAEKQAKSAPDKVKLQKVADQLDGMILPEVSTVEAQAIIRQIQSSIIKLSDYIRNGADKLGA